VAQPAVDAPTGHPAAVAVWPRSGPAQELPAATSRPDSSRQL